MMDREPFENPPPPPAFSFAVVAVNGVATWEPELVPIDVIAALGDYPLRHSKRHGFACVAVWAPLWKGYFVAPLLISAHMVRDDPDLAAMWLMEEAAEGWAEFHAEPR